MPALSRLPFDVVAEWLMRLTRNQFLSGAQVQILPTSCPCFCFWVRGAAAAYGTSDPLTSVRFRPDSEKELARGRGIDTPNLQIVFGGLAQMVERSLSMSHMYFPRSIVG